MYICKDFEQIILDKLRIIKEKQLKDISKTFLNIHGSFDRCKSKYLSDVDIEYYIEYIDNRETLYRAILELIDFLLSQKTYIFKEAISGMDRRFLFDYRIKKNGQIENYDYQKIKNQFDNLLKEKAITQEEYDKLNQNLKKNPSLISISKLHKTLEDFRNIKWELKEIKKGSKIWRGKKFYMKDTILDDKFPTILTFIMEFEPNKFINFDISVFLFKYKPDANRIDDLSKNHFKNIIVLNDKLRYESNIHLYIGFFTNYSKEKYLKCLKRLRSILSSYFFDYPEHYDDTFELGRLPKYKNFIHKIRKQILEIFDSDLSLYNQIKHNIDITKTLLTTKKSDMIIKEQIVNTLKDLLHLNFYDPVIDEIKKEIEKKKLDRKKLDKLLSELYDKVFTQMNLLALEHLIKIYKKVKFLLPFRVVLPLPT